MIDGSPGQSFDIIASNPVNGTFDNIIVPDGRNIQVNYLNSVVSVELVGDINERAVEMVCPRIGANAVARVRGRLELLWLDTSW